jgi:hypothetical protein
VHVPEDAQDGDAGRIESIVRTEAMDVEGEELQPVLRREPLGDAANKYAMGLPR